MTKYIAYKVEDFLLDESFIDWVLNNSEKEAIFWNAWIAAHPTSLPAVNTAKKALLALHIKPARQLSEEELNQMVGFVEAKTQAAPAPQRADRYKIVRNPSFSYPVAALLIMGIIIGAVFFKGLKPTVAPQHNVNTLVSRIKTQTNHSALSMLIKLQDGSSVILKPGSSLTYPTIFTGKKRDVSLNGEAFFEIHKDASRPFYVNSGDWVTRVVGTSFTIKAFNNTKGYKVVVNTGKVCVSKKDNSNLNIVRSKQIYLVPNQQLTFNTVNKSLVKQTLVKPLMLSQDVSKNIFTFYDTPFNKVVTTLEQAYNVNVIYNEKEMGGCPLTASLADEHLLEKLDLICKALNAKYYISQDGQIIMQGKGCNASNTNSN
ncbi:MAG: FecR family protein [Mucilaginibacter sp.]